METRSNYIVVGAVAVALLAALFAAVLWLSRLSATDDRQFDIFFKQSINGLALGSAVAFKGVPVGKVSEIKLLPDTPQFVRVRISVQRDVPVLEGTTAAVEGVGFTGVSQIQLAGAMQGAEPITAPGPFGVPVIPARASGLGELLASAPQLLNNATRLTEKLTELLNPDNQKSIGNILHNTDVATKAIADRSPELAATIVQARDTLKQAEATLASIEKTSNTANTLLDAEGKPLIDDLHKTLAAAQASLAKIDAVSTAAQPGVQSLSNETLPEINRLLRNLQSITDQLGAISAKLDEDPAGALIGGRSLPIYKPPREDNK
jgi:phospholipid/cholesterol/gamma-HCH transport system substrate-binding protein